MDELLFHKENRNASLDMSNVISCGYSYADNSIQTMKIVSKTCISPGVFPALTKVNMGTRGSLIVNPDVIETPYMPVRATLNSE